MNRSTPILLALSLMAFAACTDDVPLDSRVRETLAPDIGAAVARESYADAGALRGRVRLGGRSPGNPVIRMGSDPGCEAANEGRMVVDEGILAGANGELANVFVHMEGDLPRFEPPPEPVRVIQTDCVYGPRVVGVEVGQAVEISNGDAVVHNVHARSNVGNGFNVGQPSQGMVFRFAPTAPEVMLHVSCDLHRWMNAYIGIVAHSYFAVTGPDGAFSIGNIPPGTYTLHAWHEKLGTTTRTVEIGPGETVDEEVVFPAP